MVHDGRQRELMEGVSEPTRCVFCPAMIRWLVTVKGKRMPVETEAQAFLMTDGEGRFKVVRGWAPHWPNCPGAEESKEGREEVSKRRSRQVQGVDMVLEMVGGVNPAAKARIAALRDEMENVDRTLFPGLDLLAAILRHLDKPKDRFVRAVLKDLGVET